MQNQKNLFLDKRFWPIFWVQFSGAFNDNVFKNALILLIAYKAYSVMGVPASQMVALCGGIFILPFFLFSATAGQIADKFSKTTLVKIVKLAEIVVMAIGAFGFIIEDPYVLVISLFFMGFQSALFGPVKYSVLPELVEQNELVKGNAFVEMGTFLAILLGTIAGGVIIGLESNANLYISISVIAIAIIGFIFSLKVQKLEPINPERKINFGIIKPTLEILRVTKKTDSVYQSVLGISWFWFLGAALLSIFPLYVKDLLGGGEEVVTLFLAIFSIGVAVGSILCEKLSDGELELGLVPVGSIGMSIFLLDLFFIGTPAFVTDSTVVVSTFFSHFSGIRLLFDLLMFSVFAGFFTVPLYTFIQQRPEPKDRSMVIAGTNILNALFMVAASILLMLFLKFEVSIPVMFLIFSVFNLVVAGVIYTIIPEFMWRFVCFVLTSLVYKFEVEGLEKIPKGKPLLLVCNHVSFIDWLFVAAAVRKPIRFVMYYTFMKIPVLGAFFRGSKVIPIAGKNEDKELMEKAFVLMEEELKRGELLCVFPEGEITRDGKLTFFRPGVERILSTNTVDVVPMALDGLWGSFFSRKYGSACSNYKSLITGLRSKVTLRIGDIVPHEKASAKYLEETVKNLLDNKSQ